MRRQLRSSRILLTGASSGIGHALARRLAAEGADLLVTARREALLNQLLETIRRQHPAYADGSRRIISVVGDICDAETRRHCVTTAREQLGGIDLLINNAGVGATALLMETSEEILRRMMEVNYFALALMTQEAIPLLRESAADKERWKQGIRPMIVNLGSIVGLRGVPHYGAYGAAKFAVTGYGEALRAELVREKIDLLHVSPGTTQTEFFDALLVSSSAPDMPVHHHVTPEYVADRIVRAMRRGSHRIIPYAQAVILQCLQRLSPTLVDAIMARYV